jgi:beta-N-acetylhexosaminidase
MKAVAILTGMALVVLAAPATAQTEHPMRVSPHQAAVATYQHLTAAQRVGQLFMTGVPPRGAGSHRASLLEQLAIGNVVIDHDSTQSRHDVGLVVKGLDEQLEVGAVRPFVGVDQEGGEVQRLTGTGFSRMPTALRQGAMTPRALRAASQTWGAQLAASGVDLDLAPVADTVPPGHPKSNKPIGRFDREFGHHPATVSSHVSAFVRGMNASGEATTLKHFPGLGRATGNTDTQRHVTDPTTRHDPYLRPFGAGISARAPFVMVSSATYPHIDPAQPACFSSVVMTSMLRKQFGFRGVLLSDDLGTSAMRDVSLAQRALRFFAAGGTMLLDTSPRQLSAMVHAVLGEQTADPAFASTIKHAAITDLVAKARAGLVPF